MNTNTSISLLLAAATLLLLSGHATAHEKRVEAPPTQGSDAVQGDLVVSVVKDLIVQAEKCKLLSMSIGKAKYIVACREHYVRGMDALTKALTDLQDNDNSNLTVHLKYSSSEFNSCFQGIKDKDCPLLAVTQSLQKKLADCIASIKVDSSGETSVGVGLSVNVGMSSSGGASKSVRASGSGSASSSASGGASGSGRASSSGGASGSAAVNYDKGNVESTIKKMILEAEKCKILAATQGNAADILACKDKYVQSMDAMSQALQALAKNDVASLNVHLSTAALGLNTCFEGLKDNKCPLFAVTKALSSEMKQCLASIKTASASSGGGKDEPIAFAGGNGQVALEKAIKVLIYSTEKELKREEEEVKGHESDLTKAVADMKLSLEALKKKDSEGLITHLMAAQASYELCAKVNVGFLKAWVVKSGECVKMAKALKF